MLSHVDKIHSNLPPCETLKCKNKATIKEKDIYFFCAECALKRIKEKENDKIKY
tara:strand:- start:340 stop:501 length:162 start_codon:yes stop_codon:yes gene_type:complete